jgi:ribonucleoside-diphosphate reductase alpha chain
MTPEQNQMIDLEADNLTDPVITENAKKVLENRYLDRDDEGKIIETPKGMFIRVAKAIAGAEETEEKQKYYAREFYDMMAELKFLPNSPCLMNAGRRLGMLSACFVLPVEDDLESILSTQKTLALVQRAGGGTGFSFNSLRPSDSIVGSSGGTTEGPLSFIGMYSGTTKAIQQGAFRRGANMGILGVRHPDVIKWITAKEDLTQLQNYNISIAMTDEFMEELEIHPNHQHTVSHDKWGNGNLWYNTMSDSFKAVKDSEGPPENGDTAWRWWTVQNTWDLICKRAHTTGEPGLFFIDEANRNNPIANLGKIESTNPCGEIPLHPYDACNLGSINLSKFYDVAGYVDWEELAQTVMTATRFLDNTVDVSVFPVPEITDMTQKTRRIGLGVMGWADLLFMCSIPYDSKRARDLADEIQHYIDKVAEKTSSELGAEKGNFGAWDGSLYGPGNSSTHGYGKPMRNSYRTTAAPTGTISIIANCSGGIEPLFALCFKRQVMPDSQGKFKTMYQTNDHFSKALFDVPTSLLTVDQSNTIQNHVEEHGSLEGIKGLNVPDNLKKIFVTSQQISMEDHVDMQIAWQKHVDSAISKTINLSHDAPLEEVSKAYWRAYYGKCKGITVYRDGCRDNVAGMKQPMSTGKTVEKQESEEAVCPIVGFDHAYKTSMKTQWGSLHVTIVVDDAGDPIEFFAQLGKAGDTIAADLEAICRFGSLALRKGASLKEVIDQAALIGSVDIMPSEHGKITSLPDALSKVLNKFLAKETKTAAEPIARSYGLVCPAEGCSGKLYMTEGCKRCTSCEYSAC